MYSIVDAFVPGRASARLRQELQEFLGRDHVFLVSSGQAALTIALRSLHAQHGFRRVLIPAYTCYSAPAAIIRAGLEPVLVDVDPETLDLDEASLKTALSSPDVLCVIPTHLFGVPSNIDRIKAQARDRGIFVLEDAAQAFGLTTADGRRLGSIGDISVFSFGRGKHVTCGHGGLISTSSPEIAALCRAECARLPASGVVDSIRVWIELAIMSVFLDPRLYWLPAGLPFLGLGETSYNVDFPMTQLPTTGLGALRRWRSRLDRANRLRHEITEAWCREFDLTTGVKRTGPLLRLPLLVQSEERRDALVQAARRQGLGVSKMYPRPLHRIPELQERFRGLSFPGAEALALRLITLPTHGDVRASDRTAFAALCRDSKSVPSAGRAQAPVPTC